MIFRLLSIVVSFILILSAIVYGVTSAMDINLLAMFTGEEKEEQSKDNKEEEKDNQNKEDEEKDKEEEKDGDTLVFQNRTLVEKKDSLDSPPTPSPSTPPSSGGGLGNGTPPPSFPPSSSSEGMGSSGQGVQFKEISYDMSKHATGKKTGIYKLGGVTGEPELEQQIDFTKEAGILIVLNEPQYAYKDISVQKIVPTSTPNKFDFHLQVRPKSSQDSSPSHALISVPKTFLNELQRFNFKISNFN